MSDLINLDALEKTINERVEEIEYNNSVDILQEDSPVCEHCNGTGVRLVEGKAVKCLYCIDIRRPINSIQEIGGDKSKYLTEKILRSIPAKYVNKTFTPELITPPEKSSNFGSYISALSDIYSKIISGEVLSRSAYVFSFQGLGKQHWVYSCIQECLKQGLSVSPYLDTKEAVSLFKSEELPNSYFTNDYVFLKMATGLLDFNDVSIMRLLLDRRARNNRPTIIVSRYSKTYITKIDKTIEGCFISNGNGDLEKSFYEYSRLLYIPAIGNSDK